MDSRQIILISIASMLAAGLGIMSARLDVLWLFIPIFASIAAGGFMTLFFHTKALSEDVMTLSQSIENARQHITMLARHTREFQDVLSQTSPELLSDGAIRTGAVRAEEFAMLSSLVSDIADSLSELDQRLEGIETHSAAHLPQDQAIQDQARRGEARHAVQSKNSSASQQGIAPASRVAARPTALRDDLLSSGKGIHTEDDRHLSIISSQSSVPSETPHALRQLAAAAIAADRFDLCLQRVVGLPQRKIRGYEVMLRPEGADITLDFALIRDAVESVGHQLMFDRRMMMQTIRLARTFEKRGRDVSLYVDLSQRFLMSRDALDEVTSLISQSPGVARKITLAFPARLFQKAVAFERECLKELASLGFSFMVRDANLQELDVATLAHMGVSWVRLSADTLLDIAQNHETILGVDALDFVALLERHQIALLAHQVNDEMSIAELLDLQIVFAQGLVFAAPQYVQAEAFDPPKPANSTASQHDKGAAPLDRRGLRDIARRTTA